MRISTTTLESFRLWSHPDQEFIEEAELIATIRGEFTPTAAMLLGRAFDRVLDKPVDHRQDDGSYASGTYRFAAEVVEPCLEVIDRRGVNQVTGTKRYGEGLVVSRADQLLGASIQEYKTRLSTFDFEKYARSYQWRFMADMFGAAIVTYHVFCLGESERNGEIWLRGVESFNLYPYPAMAQDCRELVDRFVAYVKQRGLEDLLHERQAQAEARGVLV